MKKIILSIIAVCILLFTGCYYHVDEATYVMPTPDYSKITSKPANISKDDLPKSAKLNEDYVFSLDKIIEHKNMTYKINSVKAQKKLEIFNKDDISFFPGGVDADEQGNLTGDYSYILINITIKNDTKESKKINLSSYSITSYDNGFSIVLLCNFMKAFDKPQNSGKSYYEYTFAPEVEETFNFIYIAADSELDKNLLLVINDSYFSGFVTNSSSQDARFYKLEIRKETK